MFIVLLSLVDYDDVAPYRGNKYETIDMNNW